MTNLSRIVPFVAALFLAPVAFAQTTGEAEGGVDVLDTGEPATENQTAQDGTYVRESSGDWQIQCLRTEEGTPEPCQMYQLLRDDQGVSVAEVNIFKVEGQQGGVVAGGTFVVPLETMLTAKMTVAVDGGTGKRYDFAFCNRIGCFSRVGFTQADIDAFKRGAQATVSIVPALAPDQRVTVNMSLSGFTKGFDLVSVLQPASGR